MTSPSISAYHQAHSRGLDNILSRNLQLDRGKLLLRGARLQVRGYATVEKA